MRQFVWRSWWRCHDWFWIEDWMWNPQLSVAVMVFHGEVTCFWMNCACVGVLAEPWTLKTVRWTKWETRLRGSTAPCQTLLGTIRWPLPTPAPSFVSLSICVCVLHMYMPMFSHEIAFYCRCLGVVSFDTQSHFMLHQSIETIAFICIVFK